MRALSLAVFVVLAGCASSSSVFDAGDCEEQRDGEHGERTLRCRDVTGPAGWGAPVLCSDVSAIFALDMGQTRGSLAYTMLADGEEVRHGTLAQSAFRDSPSAMLTVHSDAKDVTVRVRTSDDFAGHFRVSMWCT